MLSIVEWGSPAPFKRTFERTVAQKCLQQLSADGYFLPDYSYFLIKALEEGDSVTTTTKRLCHLNEDNMVWNIEMSVSIFNLTSYATYLSIHIFLNFRISLVKPLRQ
jgi:hypothetical protein